MLHNELTMNSGVNVGDIILCVGGRGMRDLTTGRYYVVAGGGIFEGRPFVSVVCDDGEIGNYHASRFQHISNDEQRASYKLVMNDELFSLCGVFEKHILLSIDCIVTNFIEPLGCSVSTGRMTGGDYWIKSNKLGWAFKVSNNKIIEYQR